MMKALVVVVVTAAAAISPSAAFAPPSLAGRGVATTITYLSATSSNRRDAIENIAKLMGGAMIVTVGGGSVDPALAANNPALGGWRSKGKGGGDGSYVPGKGMRAHEELIAASNPALEGWRRKGKGGGDGSYVPGKGMRAHEELIAASNPALGGWRSKGKGGGDGSYVPGKGMRSRFGDFA